MIAKSVLLHSKLKLNGKNDIVSFQFRFHRYNGASKLENYPKEQAMFGHVQANLEELKPEEKERYHAVYCGLCHTLGERHGFSSRMGLTYDLTFLALLLSSLYEPQETNGESRCIVHPCKRHSFVKNKCVEYAADMTVALVYHKCLDDWQDERKLARKCYSSMLEKSYEKVKKQWSEQCEVIERELKEIARIEADKSISPDQAINACGRMMEAVFAYKHDFWERDLRLLGYSLGQFIYLADATVDYHKDMKKDNYNPLVVWSANPEEQKANLKMFLGTTSEALERLPLVQDIGILRNILYSGIWIKYNREINVGRKDDKNG